MPLLALPDPKDVPLLRSPLSLVVCQVRHDRVLAVTDPKHGLAVQSTLGGRYPQIDERPALMPGLLVGAGFPQLSPPAPAGGGWQMQSDDGAWTVTLQADSFSLETSAYVSWIDFRDRLDALVAAVISTYEPSLESRVGLRYVDEIVHPGVTSPTDWKGWIREELLGPLAHPEFGVGVRSVQQQIEFDAEGGYRVVLRHGTSRAPGDPKWVYLLDHDCYRQAGRQLTHDGVLGAADDLHRLALQVFQASITEDLYKYLEGDET